MKDLLRRNIPLVATLSAVVISVCVLLILPKNDTSDFNENLSIQSNIAIITDTYDTFSEDTEENEVLDSHINEHTLQNSNSDDEMIPDEVRSNDDFSNIQILEPEHEAESETVHNGPSESDQDTTPPPQTDEPEHIMPIDPPPPVIVPVSNISMSVDRPITSRYKVGDSGSVAVNIFPSNATDKGYQLSVNDNSLMTISQNGQFTVKAEGTAVITATTSNGVTREVTVTILDMNSLANEVLSLTNAERSNNGVASLASNDSILNTAVLTRANEVKTNFSHTRPDGRGQSTVYVDNGGSYTGHYMETGETIAAGYTSPAAVVNAWMNSSKSKAIILDSLYTHISIGVDMDSSGRLFWVQTFFG